jgi:putative ABC transport system permease protein
MFRTAIRFILYDKPKSLGALAGIIISTFLVGQQIGIFIFLTDAMQSLVANNSQYIWVTDNKTVNGNQLAPLDMRISREIASLPGVERVSPVVISAGAAKFENGRSSGITLIGAQAPDFIGGPWNLYTARKEDMFPEGAVLTEYFDSKVLGDLKQGDYFEINGKKVYSAGLTRGVRGFGAASYSFTTIERARAITGFSPDQASLFLVQWKKDASEEAVIRAINGQIANVRAWDGRVLAASTLNDVLRTNGIAASVGSLIGFAILSGFIIIGLTLYSSAIDRIKDYGTLKAIGATNSYITRLILFQAFVLALLGYAIGYLMVEGFRQGIAKSGTLFHFPAWVPASIFALTLVISLGGCLFAIRRIVSLEPAQVFRG